MQNNLALGLHIQPLFYHKQNMQHNPLGERDMPEVTYKKLKITKTKKTKKRKKSNKSSIHFHHWHFQNDFALNQEDMFTSGLTELLPAHTICHMNIHQRKVINDQHAACLKSHQKESGSPNTRNPVWACPLQLKIWLHSEGEDERRQSWGKDKVKTQ